MAELSTQFDVLAQGPNFEDWGDLIVIAIMAILWLVGALVKVLSGKKGAPQQGPQGGPVRQQRQRESWQERLARKAEELQRAAEARSRQAEQEARAPSPPTGKITMRQGPRGEPVMVYERPAAEPIADREEQAARQREAREAISAAGQQAIKPPTVQPRVEMQSPGADAIAESMAAVMREPPTPLQPGVAMPEPTHERVGGYDPAAIIDYGDPDALRKAILHYEILGQPLSLRGPAEGMAAF